MSRIHGVIGGPRRKRPIRPKIKQKVIVLDDPIVVDDIEVIVISPVEEIDYDNLKDNGPNTIEDEIFLLSKPRLSPKVVKRRKYKKRKKK